jgi:hypothetical protein
MKSYAEIINILNEGGLKLTPGRMKRLVHAIVLTVEEAQKSVRCAGCRSFFFEEYGGEQCCYFCKTPKPKEKK